MPDYSLGTARGVIELDSSGVSRGTAQAGKDVDTLKGKLEGASGGLTKVGAGFTAVGVAVGAGLAYAVGTAAQFEAGISAIGAVSGATAEELDRVREKALQLGADTAFSARDAAGAMEELVKAGLTVDEVLGGAADATVALAAAGGIDLPEAATIASNAMNVFNLSAADLPRVADLIAGAANASAIDVGQFGMALSQAGAVANLAGLEVDDLAVAIAAMGNAGIKGSDAGTSLKTMLSNLIPVTDKQVSLFGELGLLTFNNQKAMDWLRTQGVTPLANDQESLEKQMAKTVAEMYNLKPGSAAAIKKLNELTTSTTISDNAFFDATGSVKGMADISGVLSKALAGMTEEQKLASLEVLFGSDAIRAAAVLADSGAKGINDLAAAMGKVSAEDVAAQRLDNLSGSLEQMKGSVETAAIQIGLVLIPYVRKMVDAITAAVNWFSNLDPGMQKAIIAFIAITGAIIGVVGVLLLIAGAIGTFLTVLAPVAAVIGITAGALLGWIVVIPIIIAAIVALGILIYKNFDEIKEFLIGVWDDIKDFLAGVWEAIAGVASTVWNSIKDFFTGIWNAIKAVFSTVMEAIKTVVTAYINVYLTIITTVLNAIKAVWNAVWGTFGPLIKSVLEAVLAIVKFVLALIELAFDVVLLAILTVVKVTFAAIKAVIETVMGAIKAVLGVVLGAISAAWSAAWNAAKAVVTAVFNAIKPFVEGAIAGIMTAVGKVADVIRIFTDAFGRAKNAVVTKVGEILTFVGGIGGKIKSALGDMGSLLFNAGQKVLTGFLDGLKSKVDKVTGFFSNLTDKIPDLKGPPARDERLLYEAGQLVLTGFAEGLASEVGTVEGTLRRLTNSLPAMVNAGGVLAPAPSSSTGGALTIEVNFTGPISGTPEGIRQAVADSGVVGELLRAARAGRRGEG